MSSRCQLPSLIQRPPVLNQWSSPDVTTPTELEFMYRSNRLRVPLLVPQLTRSWLPGSTVRIQPSTVRGAAPSGSPALDVVDPAVLPLVTTAPSGSLGSAPLAPRLTFPAVAWCCPAESAISGPVSSRR